jgi:ribonuclease VapC
MVTPAVLDASALVAAAMRERGADKVVAALASAVVAAPNWAEMLDVIRKLGGDPQVAIQSFKSEGVTVEAVTEDDAEAVARLARNTANRDLSLGDKFCLAVAERLERPAYTSDQSWAQAKTKAKVVMIR